MYNWISYAADTTTTTTASSTAWAVDYITQQIPFTNIVYRPDQVFWDYYSDPKKCEPEIDRDELLDFINS